MPKPKNELEFVGYTLAAGAVAFLVGLAGKVAISAWPSRFGLRAALETWGWHITTRILRAREARRK